MTELKTSSHIFDSYNGFKIAIPPNFPPEMMRPTFECIIGDGKGNTGIEFLVKGQQIEYPDNRAMIDGYVLSQLGNEGLSKATLKGIYAYDTETYPNFFSAIFVNINNPSDVQTYVVYGSRDDRLALSAFISQPIILVGFNSESFDDIILKLVLADKTGDIRAFTHSAYKMGQRIVTKDLNRQFWTLKNKKAPWFSIDLMAIMALDVKGVSLKRAAIIMGHNKIQDLPIPFNENVKKSDLDLLLKYNLNDVEITEKLYHYIQDEIETRLSVGKLFKESLMCASRSKMGNVLITKLYQEKTGQVVKDGHDDSRIVKEILLGDCIGKNIEFESPELKELLETISDKTVYWPKYKYSLSIIYPKLEETSFLSKSNIKEIETCVKSGKKVDPRLFELLERTSSKIYDLGIGGLHSRDNGKTFVSTAQAKVIDCDVSSFYPYIIINNELFPKQLGAKFTEVYKGVVEERIRAKHAGEKTLADALKISINAVFGRLGSQYSWLYDMQVFLSVTLSGQLYLLSLIEKLVLGGIEVISANTDGVTSIVRDEQQEHYEEICSKWSDFTDFELEYTEYKRYTRRDVNNYLVLKPDGKFKTKGVFTLPGQVDLGYKAAIVPKALQAYFVDGITPLETIKASKSITDFLIAQKADTKTFDIVYERIVNGKMISEPQQKSNRYFVSNKGGSLLKVRKDNPNSKISFVAGESVTLLNDIDDYNPAKHDIKIQHYLAEIEKTIHQIEKVNSQQSSLF